MWIALFQSDHEAGQFIASPRGRSDSEELRGVPARISLSGNLTSGRHAG